MATRLDQCLKVMSVIGPVSRSKKKLLGKKHDRIQHSFVKETQKMNGRGKRFQLDKQHLQKNL